LAASHVLKLQFGIPKVIAALFSAIAVITNCGMPLRINYSSGNFNPMRREIRTQYKKMKAK
jgi:hypothetical protein